MSEELKKLEDLYEAGFIMEDEYQRRKQEILGDSSPSNDSHHSNSDPISTSAQQNDPFGTYNTYQNDTASNVNQNDAFSSFGTSNINQNDAFSSFGTSNINQSDAFSSFGTSNINQNDALSSFGTSNVNQNDAFSSFGTSNINQNDAFSPLNTEQTDTLGQQHNKNPPLESTVNKSAVDPTLIKPGNTVIWPKDDYVNDVPTKKPEHLDSVIVHYRSSRGYFISEPLNEPAFLDTVREYFGAPVGSYLVNVDTQVKVPDGIIPKGRYRLEAPQALVSEASSQYYAALISIDRSRISRYSYTFYFPEDRSFGYRNSYHAESERRLSHCTPPNDIMPKMSRHEPIKLDAWFKKSSEDTLENVSGTKARIHLLLRIRGLWIKHSKLPKNFLATGGNIFATVKACDDKSICVVCNEACSQNFLCESHFDKGCINLWNALKDSLNQEDQKEDKVVDSPIETLPKRFTTLHNVLLIPKFRYIEFNSPKTAVKCSSSIQDKINSLCEDHKN
eukprot:TRINITY_DN795_c0_g2_i1.p1 TRINITY_DN795_c0_g2~~TRINITY_DN795_c0_g2_i1.p1  ORF type:complete len:518 (-),score=79.81 TRINITY_DN795_c0_g2_i1:61-1572(-)